MEKSIHTPEYRVFAAILREIREKAGITQVELADRLGVHQVFISRYETGQVRLDILQVRTICEALGTTLPRFARKLENRLRGA